MNPNVRHGILLGDAEACRVQGTRVRCLLVCQDRRRLGVLLQLLDGYRAATSLYTLFLDELSW